jgi:hypothetical protein
VDAVADDRSNAIAAHLPGCIGNDSKLVVEQYPEAAVRKYLVDHPFDGEQFLFPHALSTSFAEVPLNGQLVASGR